MQPQNKPFDHTSYLAVLRCKTAETDALSELEAHLRDKMIPLVEVPRALRYKEEDANNPGKTNTKLLNRDDPRVPQVLDDLLRKVTSNMGQVWSDRALFFDLQHLPSEWRGPGGIHPVTACWNHAKCSSLFPPNPIPVVTLTSDLDFCHAIQGILDESNVGIGIRVKRNELAEADIQSRLVNLLQRFGLSPEQTDLIVDFGTVGESELDLARLCSCVPWIQNWRTFSCISGSFPKDLRKLVVGEYELNRWEWKAFRDQAMLVNSLPRIPTYGDYATQCAEYAEPVEFPNPSASIRYTADDTFVVIRGQALSIYPHSLQYPANAMSLCARSEFRSIATCAGDDYIAETADKMQEIEESGKGTGTPQTWLQASLNRHWTVAVNQISALFAS